MNDTDVTGKWALEIVEKGRVGEYASLVIGPDDKVHITYFDYTYGDLKRAESGPDGWIIERVDREGTVGQYLSMTKDEGGKLYASYRDQTKDLLKVAIFDGNGWSFEVVDTEELSSLDTSISVDAFGKIYISYHNYIRGCLKLATRDADGWKTEIVDGGQGQRSTIGGFSSVKADSHGRVHISYLDSSSSFLKYAVKENDTWTIEVADDCEFVGNFTSLALDKDGNPYISYTVDKDPNKPDLWLAKRVKGKWTIELVDTEKIAGNYSSIVVDRHSNIYISYSAMSKLKLAKSIQGVWSFEIVDPVGTTAYTSLALDSDGMPRIAYHDQERGVKYARKIRAA